MAYLPETPRFDDVYQLEAVDPLLGHFEGVPGELNWASQALVNRTAYLKQRTDAIGIQLAVADAAALRQVDLTVGIYVALTFGAVAVGDGGGGVWRWDASSEAVDNLGTVVRPTGHSGSGRWLRLHDGAVHIDWFGARGDWDGGSGTDDTAAIAAALESGAAQIAFRPAAKYRITATITIPVGVSVDFNGGEIVYDGPADRAALVVGDTTATGYRGEVKRLVVTSKTISWASTSYVGVRVCHALSASIDIRRIEGFAIGLECYSVNTGYAYTLHTILGIGYCKYAIVLTSDGSGALSFVNENLFIGGRYYGGIVTAALGSAFGVWLRATNNGYQGLNSNKFFGPAFELGNGSPGDLRVPFLFDGAGARNMCIGARHETGRGPFAILNSASSIEVAAGALTAGQTYRITSVGTTDFTAIGSPVNVAGRVFTATGPGTGTGTASREYVGMINNQFALLLSRDDDVYGSNGAYQNGSARFNSIHINDLVTQSQSVTINAEELITAYDATKAFIASPAHFFNESSSLYDNVNAVVPVKNGVKLPSGRGIGFFFETAGSEEFIVSHQYADNDPGRICVAVYDANFAIFTGASATYPDVSDADFSSLYGGFYNAGIDKKSFYFKVSSAVRNVRVWIHGGVVTSICVKRLTLNDTPIRLFSGFERLNNKSFAGGLRLAAVNPSGGIVGLYSAGCMIQNATPQSGQPSYWQCTTGGRLAPAWVGSTAYSANALVLSDTNKIYVCVTAGTSASSGGPTGIGSAITDGTAVWDYLCGKAVFASGPNLP